MQREWTEDDLKEIASQLGNPTGKGGVKTGEMMNLSNNGMIATTVALLGIRAGHTVLEIGPGNGKHVSAILESTEELQYTGLDISETMIAEATQLNSTRVMDGSVNFVLSNGKTIPFTPHFFDRIFTVNTIYFWKDPLHYAKEILRVLKPGGIFNLALADKSFMEKLPFTKYGFQLYDRKSVAKLMTGAGFEIVDVIEQIDITVGNMGQPVERDIMVLICRKGSG
ncbi:class I SAM-dependent methyltransferase [Dyadobacter sp. CY312]|uniref:class I SAM-dependent methyltransferase n=1 Tax=Dyadobacter sp. CY312 TaxID=2907303 RepID=UPI001F3C6F9F|nr:class I SAM-dependent methyltransferase [Dyadobacter sp. CY312]MCE7038841.1 class I SAM-dependent methyltransferase [Dyadobacter sp. CY312]